MGTVLHDKLALVVLDLAKLMRIISLLLFRCSFLLLLLASQLHGCTIALLHQVSLDALVDGLLIEHAWSLLEALKHDEVFDVFKNLVIDATKSSSASEPSILPVIIVLVVAFPDPGSL